jgi:hypothetical protein
MSGTPQMRHFLSYGNSVVQASQCTTREHVALIYKVVNVTVKVCFVNPEISWENPKIIFAK